MTLLTYVAAHAAVTVSPSLIIAVIITRNLTDDTGGAVGFTAGLCLGKLIAGLAVFVGFGVRQPKELSHHIAETSSSPATGRSMEPTALFTYAATLSALTLAPGPLVAVLAARSASRDRRGACALAIGICAGDIVVVFAICAGLGYWLQAHPEVFAFAKYAGVGFLLWMAIRMWIYSTVPLENAVPISGTAVSLFTGFAICLSSPQTVLMYLVLLPRVADLTVIRPQDMILLIIATIGALSGVFLLVILLAGTLQKALRSPASVALWGRGMASAVMLSAGWVLFS